MPDLQLAFSLAQCATIFVQNPTIIFSTHLSFDSRLDFNNALVTCCKIYLCIFTNFIPPRWIKFVITFYNSPIHHCFIVWVKWFISTQSVAMKKATLYINWPCGKDISRSFVWNKTIFSTAYNCQPFLKLTECKILLRRSTYQLLFHIYCPSKLLVLQKRCLHGTRIIELEKSERLLLKRLLWTRSQ